MVKRGKNKQSGGKRSKFLDGLAPVTEPEKKKTRSAQISQKKAKPKNIQPKSKLKSSKKLDKFFGGREKEFFSKTKRTVSADRLRKRKEKLSLFLSGLSFSRVFIAVFFIFIISGGLSLLFQIGKVKGQVNGVAYQGKSHLTKAREAVEKMDIVGASDEFKLASNEIGQATDVLNEAGQYTPYWNQLPYDKDANSSMVGSLFLIDQAISRLNLLYGQILEMTQSGDFSSRQQKKIYSLLSSTKDDLSLLDEKMTSLNNSQYFFPSQVDDLKKDVSSLTHQLETIEDFVKYAPGFLGYNQPKTYLLLFQNNAEPRPTGGFIGTFGYLTVSKGKISNLNVDQIYGPRDKLRETKLKQIIEETSKGYPEDMPSDLIPADEIRREYRYSFYVQNTNCTPDFPTSAERALWSFENVLEQPEASEVISIDPNVIENILKVTGPINLKKYGVELGADNFREVIQYKVEVDNPFKKRENKNYNPKQILVDFTPALMEKIVSSKLEERFKIFASLMDSAHSKHILAYSKDSELESFISQNGFSGEIDQTDGDYLQVNLDAKNATKSGQFLKNDYRLLTNIDSNGKANHLLTITIDNLADGKHKYYDDIDLMIRVMVPYGSKLLSAQAIGNDISKKINIISEAGKQSFIFDQLIPKLGEETIIIRYQSSYLPTSTDSTNNYRLNYQTQPGLINSNFSWQAKITKGAQLIDYSPDSLNVTGSSSLEFEKKNISQDQSFSLSISQ